MKITVDDEVYEELQARARPLSETVNDVLRGLLDLPMSDVSTGEAVAEDKPERARWQRKRHEKKRSSIHELFMHGLLKEGQVLQWYRARLGVTHRATVTNEGALLLESGEVVTSLSTACKALSGGSIQNGWDVWETEDGTPLGALRWKTRESQ